MSETDTVDPEVAGQSFSRELDKYLPFITLRLARLYVDGRDTREALVRLGFMVLAESEKFYRVLPPSKWYSSREGAHYTAVYDEHDVVQIRQVHRMVPPLKTCLTFVNGWQ